MKCFLKMSKLTNLFLEIINVGHLTAKAEKQRKYKEREGEKDTCTHTHEWERLAYSIFSNLSNLVFIRFIFVSTLPNN